MFAHYAPVLENIILVIIVVSGVGMTAKWPDPVVSFALWRLGYSIAVAGAHFRQNRRNLMLCNFLALNKGDGAINWM